jgi:hypothetical protein
MCQDLACLRPGPFYQFLAEKVRCDLGQEIKPRIEYTPEAPCLQDDAPPAVALVTKEDFTGTEED